MNDDKAADNKRLSIDELLKISTFDIEMLPDLLRCWLREAMGQSPGIHPLMVLLPFLSTNGSLINKNIFIDNYGEVSPNLWTLIIAPSGGRKSTAMRLGAQIAISKNKKCAKAIAAIDEQLEEYNKLPLKERKQLEVVTAIKELENARKRQVVKDPILADKGSSEGFLQAISNGQTATIFSTEAGSLYAQFEKDGNSDLKPLFMKAYDRKESLDHITRTMKRLYVEDPYLSMCLASTYEAIESYLTTENFLTGLMTRKLIATFDVDDGPKEYIAKIKTTENKYNEQILKITEQLVDHAEKHGPKEYEFSDKSASAYISSCKNIEALIDGEDRVDRLVKPYKVRWQEDILKIAELLEVYACTWDNFIQPESIIAAYSIVLYCIKSTMVLIKEKIGLTDFQHNCNNLLAWIIKECEKEGRAITFAEILNSGVHGGTLNDFNAILKMLCGQGKLVAVKDDTKQDKLLDLDVLSDLKSLDKVAYYPIAQILKFVTLNPKTVMSI